MFDVHCLVERTAVAGKAVLSLRSLPPIGDSVRRRACPRAAHPRTSTTLPSKTSSKMQSIASVQARSIAASFPAARAVARRGVSSSAIRMPAPMKNARQVVGVSSGVKNRRGVVVRADSGEQESTKTTETPTIAELAPPEVNANTTAVIASADAPAAPTIDSGDTVSRLHDCRARLGVFFSFFFFLSILTSPSHTFRERVPSRLRHLFSTISRERHKKLDRPSHNSHAHSNQASPFHLPSLLLLLLLFHFTSSRILRLGCSPPPRSSSP